MFHTCSHDHGTQETGARRLAATFVLVAIYFLAELIGGIWTNSLALLADAGHMFSDMTALGVSLFAAWISTQQPTSQRTYGYHRAEILAATLNGMLLLVVAGGILHEAWDRWQSPGEILGGPMLAIAVGGLVVNLISLKILHGAHNHNLNLRGAWLHVLGDTLGSVGVISAAVLIWQFGWNWADPLASAAVCLLIVYSASQLLWESLGILMEHAPANVSVVDVERFIMQFPEVQNVHCLHIWTVSSGLKALTAHVVVAAEQSTAFDLQAVRTDLQKTFEIDHITLQIERSDAPPCVDTRQGGCLSGHLGESPHQHPNAEAECTD